MFKVFYNVWIKEECIAKAMTLDYAQILLKAIFDDNPDADLREVTIERVIEEQPRRTYEVRID